MELSEIVKLAEKAEDIHSEIAAMELGVKEKKAELKSLMNDIIPSAMAEELLVSFSLQSGTEVKIKHIVNGSLPAPGAIEKAKGEAKAELLFRLDSGLHFLPGER